jgi:hypothetical protein
MVVCDTSPIGLVTDAAGVMKISDIILYVFRADYSRKAFVDNLERIRLENNYKNIFLVFNYVDFRYEGYGYGYGYHQGKYGYYSDDQKKTWWDNLKSKLFFWQKAS